MQSILTIILLAVVGQAHAKELSTNQINDEQHSMDELVDPLANKLVDRALTTVSLSQTDLDNAVLAKAPTKEELAKLVAPIVQEELAPAAAAALKQKKKRITAIRSAGVAAAVAAVTGVAVFQPFKKEAPTELPTKCCR